jgi:hypothetical protein
MAEEEVTEASVTLINVFVKFAIPEVIDAAQYLLLFKDCILVPADPPEFASKTSANMLTVPPAVVVGLTNSIGL